MHNSEPELRVYKVYPQILSGHTKYTLIRFLKNSIPCYYIAGLIDLDSNSHCLISDYKHYHHNGISYLVQYVFIDANPTIFLFFTIVSCSVLCALIRNLHMVGLKLNQDWIQPTLSKASSTSTVCRKEGSSDESDDNNMKSSKA